MQFRPSAQLLLYLRIDELTDVAAYNEVVAAESTPPVAMSLGTADQASAPISPELALTLIDIQMEALQQQRGSLSQEVRDTNLRNLQAQRDVVLQGVASQDLDDARPWALLGVSPDLRYAKVGILPRSVEIERNGFRTADTAKVVLDWADVPFDPRILRAASSEIVIGTVTDDEYQRGLAGERDPISGQLVSVVRQQPISPLPFTSTRFVGWVDNWDVEFDDETELVTLELRDFTALLLDTPMDARFPLDLSLPLDQGIAEMLTNYPTVARIPVKYQSLRDGVPVPAPIPARSVPAQNVARSGTRRTRGRTADQRTNLWDVITDITVQVGLVPVVRGYELHLIDPRVIYGSQDTVRRMIYGRNLTKLSFARKLGGTKVPTIEIRAYDPSIGRTRWARHPTRAGERASGVLGINDPPRAMRVNEVTPGGRRLDERIQTIVLKNTTDPLTLERAAASLFQQIGRQEIEGKLETSDICSWDLAAGAPLPLELSDLLHLEAGDSVELLVQPRDASRPEQAAITAGNWVGMERQERVEFLVQRGMPRRVAQQFARLQDAVASTLFRIQNVNLNYDIDDGIKISADFINYLEVREDAAGQRTVADDAQASGPSRSMVRVTGRRRDATAEAAREASARSRAITRAQARGAASTVQQNAALQTPSEMEFTLAEADAIAARDNARNQ